MVFGLREMGASVHCEVPLPVYYRRHLVGEYRADLIVDDRVIVEVKAVELLSQAHRAQLLNYLTATSIEIGMLLNFGTRPAYERVVFSNERKEPRPLLF